jgi:bacterial/archaeal transporter family-2 protein
MNQIALVLLMIFAGSLIALQGSVNSALGKHFGQPLQAAFFSFGSGFLILCLACYVFKSGLPSLAKINAAPKIILIGGALGTVFVSSVIFSVPKIGVANVVLAALCGQVIFSLILDHLGAFGMTKINLNLKRITGASFVVIGLVLINFKK